MLNTIGESAYVLKEKKTLHDEWTRSAADVLKHRDNCSNTH